MLYKKCKVVMLPTEKATRIEKIGNILRYSTYLIKSNALGIFQHLYFLSDEEIKEGDWVYDSHLKKVYQVDSTLIKEGINADGATKKIIATTDESLGIPDLSISPTIDFYYLPRPSNEFIKKYCELGGTYEVLVEYEEILDDAGIIAIAFNEPDWRLKVAPDNTITIKQIKDIWNREEVENLLRKFNDENNTLFLKSEKEHIVESFIKSNL